MARLEMRQNDLMKRHALENIDKLIQGILDISLAKIPKKMHINFHKRLSAEIPEFDVNYVIKGS